MNVGDRVWYKTLGCFAEIIDIDDDVVTIYVGALGTTFWTVMGCLEKVE